MAHLQPCPSCSRHVRVSETTCPHCRATLSPEFRAATAPRLPAGRLSRAALYALGVSTVGSAIGCNSTPRPLYGGPPPGWVREDAKPDAGESVPEAAPPELHDSPRAVYGAPPSKLPPVDAGRK